MLWKELYCEIIVPRVIHQFHIILYVIKKQKLYDDVVEDLNSIKIELNY